jgi:Flp pilus assembly protein TadD
MGRLEESEKQLRIAVEQTTADDDRTRVSLARTLTLRGRLDEAARIVDAVLEHAPNHIEAAEAKGRLLAAQGRTGEAIEFLEKAAKGGQDDPLLEIARLALDAGNANAAMAASDRVLARTPSHPWALALKGHALVAEGQKAAGVALLDRALSARPRRPEAWNALAAGFTAAADAKRAAFCRREAVRSGTL